MNPLEKILESVLEQHHKGRDLKWIQDLPRDDWRNTMGQRGPVLQIHVGPTGGLLICTTKNGNGLHTTGGEDNGSVKCHVDQYQAWLFPARAVIPIDQTIAAIQEFHAKPGPPAAVEWVEWDGWETPIIYHDDNGAETGRMVSGEFTESK